MIYAGLVWRGLFHRALIACLLLSIPAGVARAASPSLGVNTPYGAQRGTELSVTFRGGLLADVQEVLFHEPGIMVKEITPGDEGHFTATLSIAPDCRLGIHDFRVRTATGISNLRTFHIGALPEIDEVEPNSDFASPQSVELGTTVNGVIENEDVDYFVVEVKKGTRINAEIEGLRMGNFFFDPYVAIMNEGRFELDASDDSALLRQDSVASIVAPEDGRYIIQVRETAFGGNGSCNYRLHIGSFPRPRAVLPAGGKPGETIEVRYLGDVAGEATARVTLPTEETADFGLFASDEHGIAPSPNPFRLSPLDNLIEAEPNNSLAEANEFTAPHALNGVIAEPGDIDCFKFKATQGQVFDIHVYARRIRTPLDPVLVVLASNGNGVTSNDDSGGPDSYLRFTAPADDEYTLMVYDHLRAGDVDYAYRIEVTTVQPSLVMGLPELSQFVDIVSAVPRGNRHAFLVSGTRADFGGELAVSFGNLPPGVEIETVPMGANQTTVPVVVNAAPDAELAGRLVDVLGRWTDENQNVSGRLNQLTSFVRGQNNIRMWDRETHRMAMAITEEAPFSLDVVPSKAPLVRGGTKDLKVVATRREGFDNPIAVRLLYNPPDVGSAGTITIPPGQTEAVIPMNAGGGAQLGTWRLVVLGDADSGRGAVTVASPFIDLEIAEPYFGFTFQAAAVEKGQATEVVLQVSANKEFASPATVELLGLPHEVSAEPQEISKDSTELVFRVNTTANSPVGKHPTLLCRATVIENDEPVVHMIGTGELRIDEPLPPKDDQPVVAAPEPVAAEEKPPEKRLTRLEQLRLERQQMKAARAKAAEASAHATEETPPNDQPPAEAAPVEDSTSE